MRTVVSSQTSTHDFIGFLLRFDVDGGVDSKTALGHARRVLVFELLTNKLHRIIERRRLVLRLVVGSVGKLDRFGFRGISFSLAGKAVLRH